MKNRTNILTALTLIVSGIALDSPALQAQDAAAKHYVFTNNDIYRTPNSASVFQLSGTSLVELKPLETGGWGLGSGFFGTTEQAVAKVGSNVCVFVSDPGSDDIAAFNSTNPASSTKIGNYVDPTGSGAYSGIALAARGTNLYAGYSASVNLGVWAINADCSLISANPASNTPTPAPVNDLAVSPDGKTLVVTYGQTTSGVDSYAISGTTLTRKGPYNATGGTAGIDITKDSKYAIIGDFSVSSTQIEIFSINADSSLGAHDYYSIPKGGADSNNVWLSPDETVLYVSNNVSLQVTTLKFSESASPGNRLTFDCLSAALRTPGAGTLYNTGNVATSLATGKGGFLYVAEWGVPSAVAVLQIPKSGCPVEVSGSPFLNSPGGFTVSLSAYPLRPF